MNMKLIWTILVYHSIVASSGTSHQARHKHTSDKKLLENSGNKEEETYNQIFSLGTSDIRQKRLPSFSPSIKTKTKLKSKLLENIKISGMMSDSSLKQSIDIRPGISSELPALRNATAAGGANSFWSLSYSPQFSFVSMNYTEHNVTAQLGEGAFLPCRIGKISGPQVSWIRRRDWNVLTSGIDLYTHDKRFSVLHEKSSKDWILHIKHTNVSDAGKYECQVPTGTGIISIFVNLHVIVPEAVISEDRVLVKRGSDISLHCYIRNTLFVPKDIFWHHNGQLLNFLGRSDTHITNRMPKAKVITSPSGSSDYTSNITSHLRITSATDKHSGNYTCSSPNFRADFSLVYIAEEDKIAAVQRIHSQADRTADSHDKIPLFLFFIFVYR